MSELNRSDQLCLFEYLSEANDASNAAGNVSSHHDVERTSPSAQVAEPNIQVAEPDAQVTEPDANEPITGVQPPLNLALDNPDSDSPPTIGPHSHRLEDEDGNISSSSLYSPSPSAERLEQTDDPLRVLLNSARMDKEQFSAPVPSHFLPEHLSEEQERIFHLEQALDQALHYLDELNARVKHQAMLQEQVMLTEEYAYVQHQAIARLKDDLSEHKEIIAQRNLTISALESDRSLAQTNLLSLQQDQLSLRQENAQWKNACQELQQECDRQHRKMLSLEQENAAMQEQILQQARQANEHETAVQYWKDRHTSIQQDLQDLQQTLEVQVGSSDRDDDHPDMSHVLLRLGELCRETPEQVDNTSLSTPNLHSFSIPDFLIRRYRHRGPGHSKSPKDQPPSHSEQMIEDP